MSDAIPLGNRLRFGTMVSTSSREEATRGLESISRWGYEVLWAPDHVAFTGPVNDPLTTLAYLSALEPKLTFGTSVYLLPLRHPVPVAKMVATLDRLLGSWAFHFRRRRRWRVPARVRSLRHTDPRTRRTRDRSNPGDEAAVERRARRASRQIFQLWRNHDAAAAPRLPAAHQSGLADAPKVH